MADHTKESTMSNTTAQATRWEQSVQAIAAMEQADNDLEGQVEEVLELEMTLLRATRALAAAQALAKETGERFYALDRMTDPEFAANLAQAEAIARCTGSTEATHNGVRWVR